eukprot:TRINITY_DN49946_c0_g1_i1.p1 TRINITY_DN49946_c0_g1~~TRINITY_DN49946_c0_g1_i1.p1  ORF type:complete len:311 (-),score=74.42 TRINITY_DN49946_c0_g1_i1:133-1065(-)
MVAMAGHTRDRFAAMGDVGWHQTGSIGLVRSQDMLTQLVRSTQLLADYRIPFQLYSSAPVPGALPVSQIKEIHPLLNLDGVEGGLHTPLDGIVNPADACMRIVQQAKELGAEFREGARVSSLRTCDSANGMSRVDGLLMDDGQEVRFGESVLLAGGQWIRQLALTAGALVPTAVAPHQYVIFDQVPGVSNSLPVVRCCEEQIYIKPEVGGIAVGMFEGPHACMPPVVEHRNLEGHVPGDAENELYETELDKMPDGLEAAMALIPSLTEVGIKGGIHGPDTHSADHEPIMGRLPMLQNAFVATGFLSLIHI